MSMGYFTAASDSNPDEVGLDFSPMMEVLKIQSDFEYYQENEEKYDNSTATFKLPDNYITVKKFKRRIDYETPGRIPQLSKERIQKLVPHIRDLVNTYSANVQLVDRLSLKPKKKMEDADVELSKNTVNVTADSLKKLILEDVEMIDNMDENHILSLRNPSFQPRTTKPFFADFEKMVYHKVSISSHKLSFMCGRFEPLFLKYSIYNFETKEKVTEDFYFHLNPRDVVDMLKLKSSSKRDMMKFVNKTPEVVFDYLNNDNNLYLVITVNSIFDADTKPYIHPRKHKDYGKLIKKVEKYIDYYPHTQPIMFGYIPLFIEIDTKKERKAQIKREKHVKKLLGKHDKSLSMRDSKTIFTMVGLDEGSLKDEMDLLREVLVKKKLEEGDETVREKRGSLKPSMSSVDLLLTPYNDEETPFEKKVETILNEGIKKIELYTFPPNSVDILEIISSKDKKSLSLEGSITIELLKSSFQDYSNKSIEESSVFDLQEWEQSMEKQINHMQLFKHHLPQRYFVNFLYINLEQFSSSGILGIGVKKQNIAIELIVRNSDKFTKKEEMSSLKVFMKKYISERRKQMEGTYYSEVICIGDKKRPNKFFTDEIKIILPYELNENHHVVFVVKHLKREKKEGEEPEEIIGYAIMKIKEQIFKEKEKLLDLVIYKELVSGYLKAGIRKKSMKKLSLKKLIVNAKIISQVIPNSRIIYDYQKIIGVIVSVFENRSGGKSTSKRVEIINKYSEKLAPMHVELCKRLNSEEVVPHLNSILSISFTFLKYLFSYKDFNPQTTMSISKMMILTFKFLSDMLKVYPDHLNNFIQNIFSFTGNETTASMTSTLCHIWYGVLTQKKEKKRRRFAIGKQSENKDKVNLKEVSFEQCTFWFSAILKSLLMEKKNKGVLEEVMVPLEKLLQEIVSLIFGIDSSQNEKKENQSGSNSPTGTEVTDDFVVSDESIRHCNIHLAYFLCDIFSIFPKNILPIKIIHYYHILSNNSKNPTVIQENIRIKFSFVLIITSNKYFIEFSHAFPYPLRNSKEHCLIDCFFETILYAFTNPHRSFSYDVVKAHLDLFYIHLLEQEVAKDKQELHQREALSGIYFPFFEKLITVSYLYVTEFGSGSAKEEEKNKLGSLDDYEEYLDDSAMLEKNNIEILSHLKKEEREKIACIITWILSNVQNQFLIDFFEERDHETTVYFLKYLRYILGILLSQEKEEKQNPMFQFFAIKLCNSYKFFLETSMTKFINSGENDVFFEAYLFAFTVFRYNKEKEIPSTFFVHYIENCVKCFLEVLGPKLCLVKNDRIWQRSLFNILDKCQFPLQTNSNPIMIELLDLLIEPHLQTIEASEEDGLMKYEEKIMNIGKNVTFNNGEIEVFPKDSIKGASLNKVMEFIVFKTRFISEEVFYVTHKSFISTLNVLNVFFTMYKHYSQKKGKDNEEKVKQIVETLSVWIGEHFSTLNNEDVTFIMRMLDTNLLQAPHVEKIRETLLKSLRGMTLEERSQLNEKGLLIVKSKNKYRSIIPSKFKNTDAVKKKIEGFKTWKDYHTFIFQWDSREIARQMCLVEYSLFEKVTPAEFFKKKSEKGVTNIEKLTARFNGVSNWVQNALLEHDEPKSRKNVAKKFISILGNLRKLHNYNGINEIVSTFYSSPIERIISPDMIPKSWDKISQKDFNILKECCALMSHEHSYKNLRDTLEQNKFALPFLGLYQSDLIKIDCGNPDYWKTKDKEGNLKAKLINLNKRLLIANTLKPIYKFQKQPYSAKIRKVPVLYDCVKEIAMRTDFMERPEVFKRSLEILPRE